MEQSGTSALGVSPLWEICRDIARADRVVRPYGINAEPCPDAARGDVGIAPYEMVVDGRCVGADAHIGPSYTGRGICC